ncbi:LOW QUALITY PROTEIN: uncharacterized protein QC761_0028030 [Podospora bellae-mahoneyi]|uniref:Uncharacterized protein n=1 Tax=Podospora bellae-mahoneyi TaxID=2093777 RepID=A0ABR0FTR9_9PEZI|nr:LOW QUALITY PROTEIN: hypothetical protein QC761_0028030 [Podospora bellae-mahoneyi]
MEDLSHLWECQITALRDSFSADSSVGAPTSGSPSLQRGDGGRDYDTHESEHGWDEKINSVVDALDELALQSPTGKINTTATQSPRTPWFPDGDAYTETVPLRSNSSSACSSMADRSAYSISITMATSTKSERSSGAVAVPTLHRPPASIVPIYTVKPNSSPRLHDGDASNHASLTTAVHPISPTLICISPLSILGTAAGSPWT